MAESTSRQIYSPLDASRKEIRLLEIISVEPEIVCKLSTVSLDDLALRNGSSFCALSYVWGGSNDLQTITVNGLKRRITSSLEDALRWSWHHWKESFPDRKIATCRLWADGLCINQDDVPEKNHQVPMMGQIYTLAELTFCCLDSWAPAEKMSLAFDFLAILNKYTGESGLEWMDKYPTLFQPDPECDEHPPIDNTTGDAVWAFTRLNYWQRVWIFQELVMSERGLLVHQSRSIELSTLHMIARWSLRIRRKTKPENVAVRVWNMIRALPQILPLKQVFVAKHLVRNQKDNPGDHSNKSQTALNLIAFEAVNFRATDPRDYVYALLSITGHDIVPDYSDHKTVASAYLDLCAEFQRKWPGPEFEMSIFYFLSFAGLARHNPAQKYDLPSWVPNLPECCANGASGFKPADLFEERQLEYCQAVSRTQTRLKQQVLIQGPSLFAPAVIITSIADLSEVIDLEASLFLTISALIGRWPSDPSLRHPLLSLVEALGANKQDVEVWESSEVIHLIHLLQCSLMMEAIDIDGSESAAKEVTPPFGRVFIDGLGLGIGWQSKLFEGWDLVTSQDIEPLEQSAREAFSARSAFLSKLEKRPESLEMDPSTLAHALSKISSEEKHRLARTKTNDVSSVPSQAAIGDVVVLLEGHDQFTLLRKIDSHYIHVGPCSLSMSLLTVLDRVSLGETKFETIEIR